MATPMHDVLLQLFAQIVAILLSCSSWDTTVHFYNAWTEP